MSNLPIEDALPRLRDALRARNAAVLVAPPGAGKTTRVPPALLGEPWRGDGKIILLSPRRVAARAAAARIAAERGEPVGKTIGFRVRLESRISRETRVEVVTEGVFTRMILDDPTLDGVAAVLFDEFHERSLEGDLGLALALDAQRGLREDLRILVMSATLDGARVASLLDDAPIVESQGRLYPVAVRYLGRDARLPVEQAMADAMFQALREESGGVLAFLPGAREIERAAQRIAERGLPANVRLHTLYGALDARAQDEVIAPAPPGVRKIVLATSIAETSLTIEGVRVVLDCGLSRRPVYEPATGMTRLETVRASQASVAQRAGRAGRVEPGACWRLWDEGETRSLVAFDRPEMLEADLASLALDLAAWGVADPQSLAWLDPPPGPAWSEAMELLRELDALDADGRLTDEGRAMAELPVHPRLAHMLARAAENGEARLAGRIAMILSENGLGGRDPDLRERLRRLGQDRSKRALAACAVGDRLAKRVGVRTDEEPDPDRAGAVLMHAYPERVARARGKRGAFLMVNGRAASLEETDALAREPYLAIAEAAGRADRAQILLAAPVCPGEIEGAFAEHIESAEEVVFDETTKSVRARRTRRLGKVVLSDAPLERMNPKLAAAALLQGVLRLGLDALPWSEAARQWRDRVAFMRQLEGDDWPDLCDEALAARADDWLAPALAGVTRLDAVSADALAASLASLLPYEQQRRLNREAPASYRTPAGAEHAIDYACEGAPALDARIQEMFGLAVHPAIANGRAPLLLRLLSPAHRPVQTTRDLPGFWRGSYAAVKSEMKGRYPKHPWPDDPANAPPTLRAKPRS
jgi:ATP-dependent helicase HrpB